MKMMLTFLVVLISTMVSVAQKSGKLDWANPKRSALLFYQPSTREIDEADVAAAAFFADHPDGLEHMLVYNGEIRDVSLISSSNEVSVDRGIFRQLAVQGKPVIFFHNHEGTNMHFLFPTDKDFVFAARAEYEIRKTAPHLSVESRIIVINKGVVSVSYGFKKVLLEKIYLNAKNHRDSLSLLKRASASGSEKDWMKLAVGKTDVDQLFLHDDIRVAVVNVFHDYLLKITSPNKAFTDEAPNYFRWPNNGMFVKYRGTVPVETNCLKFLQAKQ